MDHFESISKFPSLLFVFFSRSFSPPPPPPPAPYRLSSLFSCLPPSPLQHINPLWMIVLIWIFDLINENYVNHSYFSQDSKIFASNQNFCILCHWSFFATNLVMRDFTCTRRYYHHNSYFALFWFLFLVAYQPSWVTSGRSHPFRRTVVVSS